MTLERESLNRILIREVTLDAAFGEGSVDVEGESGRLEELLSYLDTFEFWFNIVTPASGAIG